MWPLANNGLGSSAYRGQPQAMDVSDPVSHPRSHPTRTPYYTAQSLVEHGRDLHRDVLVAPENCSQASSHVQRIRCAVLSSSRFQTAPFQQHSSNASSFGPGPRRPRSLSTRGEFSTVSLVLRQRPVPFQQYSISGAVAAVFQPVDHARWRSKAGSTAPLLLSGFEPLNLNGRFEVEKNHDYWTQDSHSELLNS